MAVTPILAPFWCHFGTPRLYILGNQVDQRLEVSENSLNELGRSENGEVGQKISILAQVVWKIYL